MSARGAAAAGKGSGAGLQNQEVAHALTNVVQTPTPFPGGSFLPPLA